MSNLITSYIDWDVGISSLEQFKPAKVKCLRTVVSLTINFRGLPGNLFNEQGVYGAYDPCQGIKSVLYVYEIINLVLQEFNPTH